MPLSLFVRREMLKAIMKKLNQEKLKILQV